jgi:ABC-2 type transport system permease protein
MSGVALTAGSGRVSLLRLGRVEGRKMLDTRAGLWLAALTVLSAVAAVVAELVTGEADTLTAGDYFADGMLAASVLLPIVPILLMTSEWTQRTALSTFAFVPARERVLGAKLLAVAGLLGAVIVLSIAMALLATVAGGAQLSLPAGDAGRVVLYEALVLLFGFGLAAVLMNSAAAIVLNFITPVIIAAIGALSSSVNDAIAWIDPSAFGALTDATTSGGEWAKILTAGVVWVALPIALGAIRLRRRDVA